MSQLGTPPAAEGYLERRLTGAILVLLLVWIVLLARLFYLQALQGDRFRVSAERNSIRTHRVEPPRGIIFDHLGTILADSRPSFDAVVIPHESPDLRQTLERVAHLAELDPAPLLERFGDPKGRARFRSLRVVHDLGRDALARLEARLLFLPGVLTQVSPVRFYPFEDAAAHVLGTLGEIDASQLGTRRYAGYRRGDVIGRSGIESVLDRSLRGRAGGRNVLVDAHGRELELLDAVDPTPGLNVVLTLDARLQRIAEAGLDATGRTGAVVALDPRSGAVRVLASRPAFDPNRFASGIDQETWSALLGDPRRPLQNRALQGQYPPGSTFKVVTAIAALEEGVVGPDTKVTCTGSYRLGRRRYRCWRRGGHGEVDLHRAIVESCDVYFYQAARDVGIDRLAYYARALGLGAATGFEPGPESAGLVPTRAWKERRFGEPWVEGETLTIGIGQGFNLWTPIQLAVVYASLANGGTRYRPFVVERVEDPHGRVLRTRQPSVSGRLPIARETLRRVREALRGVVHDERGTGARLRGLPGGAEAAGKTGTAQVVALTEDPPEDEEEIAVALRDHAWFVGYAPADAPELVVAVLIEHGGHGASAAAPIAREVLAAQLSPDGEPHARR